MTVAIVAEGPTIDRIEADYRAAFKRGEQASVATLRMVKAAVKNASIAKRGSLDEAEVLTVVVKEQKQRRDSAEQYTKGGRPDLAAKEQAEITLLSVYVPEALTDAQLGAVLDRVIAEVKPQGMNDVGRVMARVMGEVSGRADGTTVQVKVKERLTALAGS